MRSAKSGALGQLELRDHPAGQCNDIGIAIRFHLILGKAIQDNDPASNLALEPGDIVSVFSQHDIVAPEETQTRYVKVEGEVEHPGIYQLEEGKTIKDVLASAGGSTARAYPYGASLTRESARSNSRRAWTRWCAPPKRRCAHRPRHPSPVDRIRRRCRPSSCPGDSPCQPPLCEGLRPRSARHAAGGRRHCGFSTDCPGGCRRDCNSAAPRRDPFPARVITLPHPSYDLAHGRRLPENGRRRRRLIEIAVVSRAARRRYSHQPSRGWRYLRQ